MGGRGASSSNTNINSEMTQLRSMLNEYDYISKSDTEEFIEDVKYEIEQRKELLAERGITDKDEMRKRLTRGMRNYIGGKYMFQDGRHNDEILKITQGIAKKTIK